MSAVAAAPPHTGKPLVDAILSGQAPPPVRLAAARGALPVTRAERLLLCVRLRADAESQVRQAAEQRLAGEARADVEAALEAGESLAAEVLDHFASRPDVGAGALEKMAALEEISNAALEAMAGCPHPSVLERIVINQTRLLGDPEIVRRLEANAHLSPTARRLLNEFKQEFWEKTASQSIPAGPSEGEAAAEPEAAGAAAEHPGAAAGAEAPEEAGAAPELTPEEASDEVFKAAYVRIMSMAVPEKIALAIKATREERAVLVRDANKQVATSVLKSPKLTDQEIEQIANMRNVSDEVLRIVAGNRNWTRNYAVTHALCRNPKTPVGVSIPFLNRLNIRDLKNMLADRNISEAVRKMTKKLFDQRNQANQPAFKKR